MDEFEKIDEDQLRVIEHYNPVTVSIGESLGTVVLAVISLVLLFALLSSQRRVRKLQEAPGQVFAELVEQDA